MRSVDEIYQEMLSAFAQRAGFVPEAGCDLAVRLYAAAAQIQALGIQAEWVLDQSFPQTARGEALEHAGIEPPACVQGRRNAALFRGYGPGAPYGYSGGNSVHDCG